MSARDPEGKVAVMITSARKANKSKEDKNYPKDTSSGVAVPVVRT